MAATQPAINRILFVTKSSKTYTSSPATITGNPLEVFSYRLRIAHRDSTSDPWTVLTDDQASSLNPFGASPTTSRHLRAARIAIG